MTRTRPRHTGLVLLAGLLAPLAHAQTPPPPRAASTHAPEATPAATASMTGDGWLDAQLADVNRYARRYPEPFADELVRYANAPRELIAALLKAGWPPADVYYACTLASVAGQPCRALAQARGAQPGEPWAATAARVGIPADAPMLQQVRARLVASYRRWGRAVLPEVPAASDDDASAPAAAQAQGNDKKSRRKRSGH